jgi:hypothetical protein
MKLINIIKIIKINNNERKGLNVKKVKIIKKLLS